MHRKALALAIVLLVAALAPATAIIGFCARMPCCDHGAADSLALTTSGTDCCTTISCYDAPSAKLATAASTSVTLFAMPAFLSDPVPLVPPNRIEAPVPIDTSPPRTAQHRLALLSLFLI